MSSITREKEAEPGSNPREGGRRAVLPATPRICHSTSKNIIAKEGFNSPVSESGRCVTLGRTNSRKAGADRVTQCQGGMHARMHAHTCGRITPPPTYISPGRTSKSLCPTNGKFISLTQVHGTFTKAMILFLYLDTKNFIKKSREFTGHTLLL